MAGGQLAEQGSRVLVSRAREEEARCWEVRAYCCEAQYLAWCADKLELLDNVMRSLELKDDSRC